MPHLWYRKNEEWIAERLSGARTLQEWTDSDAAIVRICATVRGASRHALLDAKRSVRVNGETAVAGLRVLRDRDEILCPDGRRLWFSSEAMAEAVPFGLGEESDARREDSRCPRCRESILEGSLAVACPACGVFYHQNDERHCYDFHDECVICRGPTFPLTDTTLGWMPCAL